MIDSKIIRLEILFLESAKKIQKFESYIFDKLTQIFVFKKLFFFKKKKVKLLISHTCFLDYSGSLCFFVRGSCWLSSLEKGTKPFFFFHFLHLHIAFFFSYMWPHGMCWSNLFHRYLFFRPSSTTVQNSRPKAEASAEPLRPAPPPSPRSFRWTIWSPLLCEEASYIPSCASECPPSLTHTFGVCVKFSNIFSLK